MSAAFHTFGGEPAPPPVVDGWRQLLDLPAAARDGIWKVLAPALLEPSHPGVQENLDAFCREHELPREQVVAAVHACDVLLRAASARDLDGERFEMDLLSLSGDRPEFARALVAEYEGVKGELRNRILKRTLAEHGNVLLGLDWRVDKVLRSNHGEELNASVVLLTIRYREGSREDRITLQLTPGAMRDIQGFAARFGEPGGGQTGQRGPAP